MNTMEILDAAIPIVGISGMVLGLLKIIYGVILENIEEKKKR